MTTLLSQIVALIVSIFTFYESIGNTIYDFYIVNSRTILDYMHIFFDSFFYFMLYITIILTFAYFMMGVILLFKNRKTREFPVKDSALPKVTIQIPTYNELAALNCAKKCLNFDYPKSKYNIIIGDDSCDKTISKKIDMFVKKNKDMITVTRRGSNRGYKPGNLNHMLKYTKGEYIVIFDSDFLPEKDFLRRLIAPFVHDSGLSAVQARWITKNYSQNLVSIVGGTIPLLTHFLGLPFLNLINGNSFIGGSAEAIKKSDLLKMGGWQAGSLTEDIEYSLRLTKAGKRIIYLDTLHCKCEAPFTLPDLGKQQMRWSYGVITAIKEHFSDIVFSKRLSFNNKINIFLLLYGYVITFFFFILAITGLLSIITHRPEIINWGKLISETTLNIVLTSGFLMATTITLILGKKIREIPRMFLASFTVGLIVINIVTLGIFKAIFNRPMEWFMLTKQGNKVTL